MDYISDSKIDPDALDVELLNQTQLAISYGVQWAEKSFELSKLKEQMRILEADLTVQVNNDPAGTLGDGTKATVDNIKSYITRNNRRKLLENDILAMERDVAIFLIAKNEISNSRKSALENLVRLANQNYFATPNIPRNLSTESEKRERAISSNQRVAEKMKRSK